jgi:hypothetical protein
MEPEMTEIEKLYDLAVGLQRNNRYWAKWGTPWGIVAYLRDRGVCQYCGCNLFENFESLFGKQELDHLLPKTRYPHLEIHIWNLVTACRLCNNLKRHWDPNEAVPIVYHGGPATDFGETHYLELLRRAKLYVDEKRRTRADEFESAREAFAGALASLEQQNPVSAQHARKRPIT